MSMTDRASTDQPCESDQALPTRDELQAELLDVPDPAPDISREAETPGLDAVLSAALRHVRAQRGGDLLAVVLVGSGTRRVLTPHSDLDLIAVLKGEDEKEEVIRIADREVEIRYRGQKVIERELPYAARLPPILRKGRVLFELDATGTKLIDKAIQRFRQGPPPLTLNEKIRLKAQCLHWLGKAQDLEPHPVAGYLLALFTDDAVQAYFRLRGFWLTSPADTVRFVTSREPAVGESLTQFLAASTLAERLELGRRLADLIFRDIPLPPRVD